MSREFYLNWFKPVIEHLRSYFVGGETGDLWWVTNQSAWECTKNDRIFTQAGLSVGSNVRGSVISVTLRLI